MKSTTLAEAVRSRVAAVDDPEFPGVTIADLGMVESVFVDATAATVIVDLLPTFLGCPALEVIAADVAGAAVAVPGIDEAEVRFLSDPVWSIDRINDRAREQLAREFTVAVPFGSGGVACPVCASGSVESRSPFGPTACRAISYCPSCRNPIEVMRQ
jgi:ring-1,2-phenylacetyl-CoA epoxidase subunit PaaD